MTVKTTDFCLSEYKVRINGEVNDYDLSENNTLDKNIETIILTVKNEYGYLL